MANMTARQRAEQARLEIVSGWQRDYSDTLGSFGGGEVAVHFSADAAEVIERVILAAEEAQLARLIAASGLDVEGLRDVLASLTAALILEHHNIRDPDKPRRYYECKSCNAWAPTTGAITHFVTCRSVNVARHVAALVGAGVEKARIEKNRAVQVLRRLYILAEELCYAVDSEGEDIGGHRGSLTILGELGPVVSEAEEYLADLPADLAPQPKDATTT